jgi:hypothetical protein
MNELDIPSEFIQEQKLGQTRSNSGKKGGRYTKNQIETRRKEVHKLHFEYGYSARKISDLMHIHKNTITNDVKFLYSQLKKNWDELDVESLLLKQIMRMESQRTRILERLEKVESFELQLSLEKMISEIDNRLSNLYFKVRDSDKMLYDYSIEVLNKWMRDLDLDVRAVTKAELQKLSKPTYDKIVKLIKNDRTPWGWQKDYWRKTN